MAKKKKSLPFQEDHLRLLIRTERLNLIKQMEYSQHHPLAQIINNPQILSKIKKLTLIKNNLIK